MCMLYSPVPSNVDSGFFIGLLWERRISLVSRSQTTMMY